LLTAVPPLTSSIQGIISPCLNIINDEGESSSIKSSTVTTTVTVAAGVDRTNNSRSSIFGKSATTFAAHIKQGGHIAPSAVVTSASSTPSGAPVDSNDSSFITALPVINGETGRVAAPQLLASPNGSCSVSTKTREEWATISNEEAVRLLFDINSRVGEADLSLWNDQQLKYLVDVIEPGIVL
jgi:hypothetical protein